MRMVGDMLIVHMTHRPQDPFFSYLCSLLSSNIQITFNSNPPSNCQILINGRPQRQHIKTLHNLKSLIIPYAGLPVKTRELMREFSGIAIHNIHHNAIPTAEMAIALMFAASKLLVPIDRKFRSFDWSTRFVNSVLLFKRNILILGYGAIGRLVAKSCQTLGMEVYAIRRQTCKEKETVDVYSTDHLRELLPKADVLMVCLPLTPSTEGMIGCEELSLLPEKSIVINIGRGAIIEEKALYEHLANGKLHAAGLDVWYNYPKDGEELTQPGNYPFHELENIVMSPHRAGRAIEAEELRMEHLAQLLNSAANGEEMPGRVDIDAGY